MWTGRGLGIGMPVLRLRRRLKTNRVAVVVVVVGFVLAEGKTNSVTFTTCFFEMGISNCKSDQVGQNWGANPLLILTYTRKKVCIILFDTIREAESKFRTSR